LVYQEDEGGVQNVCAITEHRKIWFKGEDPSPPESTTLIT